MIGSPCCLNVDIPSLKREPFDELPARFDMIAHERRENPIRGHRILDRHLEQSPYFWIHRGIP